MNIKNSNSDFETSVILTPFEVANLKAASFVQNLESFVSLKAYLECCSEEIDNLEDEKEKSSWNTLLNYIPHISF